MVYLPFTVNDAFKATHKPHDVLLGSIHPASDPKKPNSTAYRPTHKSSEKNSAFFSGDLRPTKIPDSFLRSSFHPRFFEALDDLKTADCVDTSRLRLITAARRRKEMQGEPARLCSSF